MSVDGAVCTPASCRRAGRHPRVREGNAAANADAVPDVKDPRAPREGSQTRAGPVSATTRYPRARGEIERTPRRHGYICKIPARSGRDRLWRRCCRQGSRDARAPEAGLQGNDVTLMADERRSRVRGWLCRAHRWAAPVRLSARYNGRICATIRAMDIGNDK